MNIIFFIVLVLLMDNDVKNELEDSTSERGVRKRKSGGDKTREREVREQEK